LYDRMTSLTPYVGYTRLTQWRHSLLTRLALRQGPRVSRGPEQL